MRSELQHSNWTADLHPPRWLWSLLVALPLIALLAFIGYQTAQTLPRIALVPGYSLLDQKGEQLTNEMMRGKLVIYAFIDTDCQLPCIDADQLSQQLEQDASAVQSDGIPLHFVISSRNPDMLATLSTQAGQKGAVGDQWHFVSDDPDHFRNILQSELEEGDASSHSASFLVLADGWGIVRAVYPTLEIERLRHDVRLVTKEARNSTGANRFAYEAVHLFMCHSDLNATTYTQP